MKKTFLLTAAAVISIASLARASVADTATISVTGNNTGATPFINFVDVTVTPAASLTSVQFTISPKSGSVTRPVSATYSTSYLTSHNYYNAATGQITIPVYGLYAGSSNSVRLTARFADGSTKPTNTTIVTQTYEDGGTCKTMDPTVVQARTDTKELSYDFLLVATQCDTHSPHIIDTDGVVRWVGTADVQSSTTIFYDNAVYLSDGPRLLRIEMDGNVSVIGDYTESQGAVSLHHNIEVGKRGLVISIDTQDQVESVNLEVNPHTGEVLDRWDFANIIHDAIVAGGQDPGDFIRTAHGRYDAQAPDDWWHNNAQTYRRADDTLLVSSRENFVIALDYDSKAIKWIFGDTSKRWHQFNGLAQYTISPAPGTLAPDGEHALSITKDNNLLLFDNGEPSLHQVPAGPRRGYSSPRKYVLDLEAMVGQAIWRYDNNFSIYTPFCSSVYEDSPMNYAVDYAVIGGINANTTAQIFGLLPNDDVVFKYQYPSGPCTAAYRSIPIHLEDTSFPTSNVSLSNISSRSDIETGDNVGIAGFIVSGTDPKPVIIRGLGPSLKANGVGLPGRLSNPTLALYDSTGHEVASNDNYKEATPVEQAAFAQYNLTPSDDRESAIARILPAGSYTAVLRANLSGVNDTTGIGLVEVYDVDKSTNSKLANLSTRAYISTGDKVLIGGILLRGNVTKRIMIRGLGPELQDSVSNALADPKLDVMDSNGTLIATNDDWQTANNTAEIQQTQLQPTNAKESAILMPFIAGDYTVILSGNGANGTGLLETYQLD